jgi:raffinose/stachyose/melibiose transport system permease protein
MTTHASVRATPHPVGAKRPQRRSTTWAANYPFQFLIPAFLVLVVFYFLPSLFNFIYALTNWSSFHASVGFVGLSNFSSLLSDGTLLADIKTTLIFAALVAIFQNIFGLVLALVLERDTRLNRAARVAFFVPVVMSALAIGYVFQAFLKPHGALDAILGVFTGHSLSTDWLGSTTWAVVVVALIQSWKWMGLSMLIYLAGLKTISGDVLEAATLDGAGWWALFRRIRFPLIAPALTFNVATALLGSMNGFDTVQATTRGGPGGSTELLNIYIFRSFGQGLFAQATTMSLTLFIIVGVLAFPVIGVLRRRERVL